MTEEVGMFEETTQREALVEAKPSPKRVEASDIRAWFRNNRAWRHQLPDFYVPGVTAFKELDCANYGACLDQALAWPAFSCEECQAYCPQDHDQLVLDMVRLIGMGKAAENVEKEGGPCRTRGVKPGADAKRGNRKRPNP